MHVLTKRKGMIALALLCAMAVCISPLYAAEGVKVGQLVVKALPKTGHNLIVQSSVDVTAVFTSTNGKKEYYIGEMGIKFGLDLSHKTKEQLAYLVFSPSSDYKVGSYALQGKYFGTKASASMGAGAGAQILLGGFEKSISLQPLALEGNTGYGATAGIGYLYLQKDPGKY
jgi:hypothetical protein